MIGIISHDRSREAFARARPTGLLSLKPDCRNNRFRRGLSYIFKQVRGIQHPDIEHSGLRSIYVNEDLFRRRGRRYVNHSLVTIMSDSIKAFLFDLDGVIVHTDRYHYLAWKQLADENGWAFDEAVNNSCRGVPRLESLEVILNHNKLDFSTPVKESLTDRKNRYYVDLLNGINEADLYPGAVDFLEKIRAAGIKTALCSSSRNAQLVLVRLGLSDYFDAVVTGSDIQFPKPDPEIFLTGAKLVGVSPEQCVVFEDAISGVEGALAAGMRCVGVGEPEFLPNATWTIIDYNMIHLDLLLACAGV